MPSLEEFVLTHKFSGGTTLKDEIEYFAKSHGNTEAKFLLECYFY